MTTVTTQQEFNEALKAPGYGEIIINSPRGVWIEITETGEDKYVRASGSATVRAYDSATVSAYDSATVSAYGSATVRAYDSATVSAYDSATVSAYDSATVRAYGSATVRAYDSATVSASRYVAVHLFSARVAHDGGVLIDLTALDLAKWTDYVDYYSIEIDGDRAIFYKAVDSDLESERGFSYPLGETVTAPDWAPGNFCGGGLHLSPTPHHALRYYAEATRFLRCSVPTDALSILDPGVGGITPKIKTREVTVLAEVDIDGQTVAAA